MGNSEEDREYFRRLGDYKRASHEDALREHLALPLDERLARGWRLSLITGVAGQVRNDDPSPFYARARALGLYIS